MVKAVRANVVLRIKEEDQNFYLGKGYSIYDLEDNLIKKSAPQTLNEYKQALMEANARIEELEAEIKQAKKKKEKKDK